MNPGDRLVLWLAQQVARTRPIAPYPGWRFAVAEVRPGPLVRVRRALWRYCNGRRLAHPITMAWGAGLRVRVFLGNDVSRCLFIGGCFEPNELAFLAGALEPGMTVVDVGANDGLYTLFAAERVGPSGQVLAVEPSRREYGRLTDNLALNRLTNVRARRLGLADRNGEALLKVAGYEHEGQNTLGEFHHQGILLSHTEAVPVRRLDDLVREEGLVRVDAVKVDAEGAERAVLAGAEATLARWHPLLLLEVSDAALRRQASGEADVLGRLRELGYACLVFDRGTGRPVPLDRPLQDGENVVAVHPDRPAREAADGKR